MNEDRVVFGWDLSIDLVGCNGNVSVGSAIKKFAVDLCKVIDMVPYGEPLIPYFGEKSEVTKGYSLLQFVETSSITGHFSDYYKSAHIDVFSCKEFDAEKTVAFCMEVFGGKPIVINKQTRYCK
jgi:S-adenosylmethionine decarboxylase